MMVLLIALYAFVISSQAPGQTIDSRKVQSDQRSLKLKPHRISLSNGRSFDLNVPEGFAIKVAAEHDSALSGYFLAGLHGSTKKSLNHGYRVVRLRGRDKLSGTPEDFINGFLKAGKVNGRPVDILSFGTDAFLLTDDYAGVVYYVHAK